MITRKVIFEGRVQGVGFRYTTKQLALGFDVIGTVENLPDGNVQLLVAGENDEVQDFIHEIVEESELASLIKGHQIFEAPPLSDCQGFTITT